MAGKERNQALDGMKGLLVYGMIYTHVLQFFGPRDLVETVITDFFNLITFSGFLFCFGYSNQLAYYAKPFRSVVRRMAATALKTLAAFYISGIWFRVFVDGRELRWVVIKPILLLEDIPGWSEFLITFTLISMLGIVCFPLFQRMTERKWVFWIICALLLLTAFIPYEHVTVTQLGLLIGTTQFSSFPAVQYLPYYLIGTYFAKHQLGCRPLYLIGSFIATGVFIGSWIAGGLVLPQRFPPSLPWIAGAAGFLYLYFIGSNVLTKYTRRISWLTVPGTHVLFFLLISNIVIFSLDGSRHGMVLSAWEGLWFTAILCAVIFYFLSIVTRGGRV